MKHEDHKVLRAIVTATFGWLGAAVLIAKLLHRLTGDIHPWIYVLFITAAALTALGLIWRKRKESRFTSSDS